MVLVFCVLQAHKLVNVLRAAFLFWQVWAPYLDSSEKQSNWQMQITALAPLCLELDKMKKGAGAKKSKQTLPVSSSKQNDLSPWRAQKSSQSLQKSATEEADLAQNPLEEALNYLEKSKNWSPAKEICLRMPSGI